MPSTTLFLTSRNIISEPPRSQAWIFFFFLNQSVVHKELSCRHGFELNEKRPHDRRTHMGNEIMQLTLRLLGLVLLNDGIPKMYLTR